MLKLVNREKLPCVDFAFERLMEKAPHFKAHITVGIDDGLSLPPQGYEIKQEPERITVSAPDAAGLMYGVLDLARMIESSAVEPRRHEPYIKKRGIKFNLPLDARTPQLFRFLRQRPTEHIEHVGYGLLAQVFGHSG